MNTRYVKDFDKVVSIYMWTIPKSIFAAIGVKMLLLLIFTPILGYALGLPSHEVAGGLLTGSAFPIAQVMLAALLALYFSATLRCWRGFPLGLSSDCARLIERIISAVRYCWWKAPNYIIEVRLSATQPYQNPESGTWDTQTQHTAGVSPPLE